MPSTVILLTGQYGTSHKIVADTLCEMANTRSAPTAYQPIAKTYFIDDAVWNRSGGPGAFFRLPNDKARDEVWQDAFSVIQRTILKDDPVYAIVSLHVVYLCEKRFFSCVDWDRLISLKPQVIITLIDDIYDIYERIINQPNRNTVIPDGKISLSDILSWRIREIHTCNLLAKHLYIKRTLFPSINDLLNMPMTIGAINIDITKLEEDLNGIFNQSCDHFVISVKQDPEDFYRLLFNRNKIRIYLSFPISRPRKEKNSDFFEKLLAFRKKIHNEYIVFDPLAIDELRFITRESKKGKKTVTSKLANRITYGIGKPIVPPPINTPEKCPIQDSESIDSIYDSVTQQINERDLKLTSQAELVIMWRPLYGKETHDGVAAEGTFAAAKGITVHSYHPKQDRMIKGKPFIHNIGTQHPTEEALFKAVEDCQKNYAAKQQTNDYRKPKERR